MRVFVQNVTCLLNYEVMQQGHQPAPSVLTQTLVDADFHSLAAESNGYDPGFIHVRVCVLMTLIYLIS